MHGKTAYTIYRPDYLSDLWFVWNRTAEHAGDGDALLLSHVQKLFDIESVSPVDEVRPEPWSKQRETAPIPSILVLHCRGQSNSKPLMFLYSTSFELHVPEGWLFSGDTRRDEERFDSFMHWSKQVADIANAPLCYLEIDGSSQEIINHDLDSIDWAKYRTESYERCEADFEVG